MLCSRELAFRNKLVAVVHEHVWPLLEAKAVVPRVQQVFKMSEAPQAIALLEQGRVMGKVVCTVAGELLRADP